MTISFPSLAVASLTLGCASAAGSLPPTSEQLQQKQGVEHNLSRLTVNGVDVALLSSGLPTLVLLPNGRVAGFGGLNRYFGAFRVGDAGRVFWLGPGFASTLMAGPPEAMQLEHLFLRCLHATTSIALDGPALIFRNHEDTVHLEFTPRSPDPLAAVQNRTLRLTRLAVDGTDTPLPPDIKVALKFEVPNRVSGFAGVNLFRGTYAVAGEGTISFPSDFATTRRAGPPELMTLEAAFLRALTRVTQIEVTDGIVILTDTARTIFIELATDE